MQLVKCPIIMSFAILKNRLDIVSRLSICEQPQYYLADLGRAGFVHISSLQELLAADMDLDASIFVAASPSLHTTVFVASHP